MNAGGMLPGTDMPQAAGALRVFINYRRADTGAAAWLIFERLSGHLGADNVFFDVEGIGAGTKWLEEIKRHGARGAVVLALIGPTWTEAVRERRPPLARQRAPPTAPRLIHRLRHRTTSTMTPC